MRRTSARLRLAGAMAVATAIATLGALTTAHGATAETPAPESVTTLSVGTPTGFGAGTTGGAGGSTVTVTNASQFTEAVNRSGALQVRVNGTINLGSMTRVSSNKTIIGVGNNGRITGSGLNVRQASNVIIQNLTFTGSNDDAINIEESTRIWVDHNTLSNAYDGLVDIKRGSDSITVSWNRVTNHDKTMLLGHSDSNGSQDRGKLRVSYHHNWYDGTKQRNPRVRFGNPVHVYNNYYGGVTSYGVASTVEAGVLVEGNYFENVRDPFHLGEGSSPGGSLVARNNHFVNSSTGQTGGSVRSIPYSYSLDNPSSVKSIVMNGAGAGRI